MYRLTDHRFQQAEGILEEYRALLHTNFEYSTGQFENKLKECWNVGYQEIKDILIDLIKRYPRFRYLALYYMQYQNAAGPVSEFKITLAEQYGADYYGSDEYEAKKKEFWDKFKKNASENL